MTALNGKIRTDASSATNTAHALTLSTLVEVNMAKASLPNSNSKSKICSVADCPKSVKNRGLCSMHAKRLRVHGNVHTNLYSEESCKQRFWSRVDIRTDSECWPWAARLDRDGYGMFCFRGSNYHASKLAYWFTNGRKPFLSVLHTCDNAACCNPAHLYEGTQRQNINDKIERNRMARGEANGSSRYTTNQIEKVCRLIRDGLNAVQIERIVGVKRDTVKLVRRGKQWRHISVAFGI